MNKNNLLVIGLGLMAGSLALSLKECDCFNKITGYDINKDSMSDAINNHIIDDTINELSGETLTEFDYIILGTPVSETLKLLPDLASKIDHNTIIFDLGSVKKPVITKAREVISNQNNSNIDFIGGHPMVGSHKQGIKHVMTNLFTQKPFILTPVGNKKFEDDTSVNMISQLLVKINSHPVVMSAEKHDHIVAALSHIPHLIASVMVNTISTRSEFDMTLAGGSFKDMTRVAKADPLLWEDIFHHNNEEIVEWWEEIKGQVDQVLASYQRDDSTSEQNIKRIEIKEYLSTASNTRQKLESRF
ncbi:prephenate dehydrogenase [Natranaerobius thermophilus]|uniref:Prephenate dehydrogenase n=1 Tax=Natranaerobius thermophilus (strain ATCC BAA-1301 / DSM 18059 / JW/NM-WN-LF) TaxID=457570 RepID=B2A727_NATTJ|nr:prephenate dehydrogenase/arogenate dehydrogenase family protein [Natranaerobius thermophilus]ACB85618.1 Prephenate dehydrogenase [Natranaerobius thermophilus JW/NM-WN-LF]